MSTSQDATADIADDHQPELKRVMGPKLLLLFIVGDILGAGVYAVTGRDGGRCRRHRVGRRSWWRSSWRH